MGEFDLSLIREFRSRPAFYDRSSPKFKDKVYTAHEWQEISHKLGFDVSLLKDRMLQLRNRYNLEKRRLEQLREENPGKLVESPWPLYEQLHFLSDHIRSRRSYKRMLPLDSTAAVAADAEPDLSNSGSNQSFNSTSAPFANGMLAVKMEDNCTDGAESDSEGNPDTDTFIPPPKLTTSNPRDHSTNAAAQDLSKHMPTLLPPSITIRRLETMREEATVKQKPTAAAAVTPPVVVIPSNRPTPPHRRCPSLTKSVNSSNLTEDSEVRSAKRLCLSAREMKYDAFGSFMSSSLLELPPKKALLLVEKFTSELVKVLIQKNEAAELSTTNNAVNGNYNS